MNSRIIFHPTDASGRDSENKPQSKHAAGLNNILILLVMWFFMNNTHIPLQRRHNDCVGVSNHRRLYCLFNRLFRRRSKKTSKLRVTGLCDGNLPVTGGFIPQRVSNTENVSIWWRHHANSNRYGVTLIEQLFFAIKSRSFIPVLFFLKPMTATVQVSYFKKICHQLYI